MKLYRVVSQGGNVVFSPLDAGCIVEFGLVYFTRKEAAEDFLRNIRKSYPDYLLRVQEYEITEVK